MATRDPFRRMMAQMESAFEQFRSLTDEAVPPTAASRLPVDVREEDSTIIVSADLPGVEKDQIDVRVTADSVRIHAEDVQEVTHEEKNYVRRERNARRYQRTVPLPARIDPSSAAASYENGVLRVTADVASGDGGHQVTVE